MNRSQAIKKKCLECGGGVKKEVTLCHIVTCSLWPFRFGYLNTTKRYNKRMESARKKYPNEYREMLNLVTEYAENSPNLLENAHIEVLSEENTTREG